MGGIRNTWERREMHKKCLWKNCREEATYMAVIAHSV
jgi:hypothetical protein